MSKNRIVHCMYAEKFIDPFITFVEKHFDADQHLYLIKRFLKYEVTPRNNTKFISATITFAAEVLFYIYHLNYSKKIIIHGLFNPRLVVALFVQPWLLKKCYWVMWGGDLYYHDLRSKNLTSNIYEWIRKKVIKRIGNFITFTLADYDLAKKWYGVKGNLYDCFVYQSNLYVPIESYRKNSSDINILIGNSANPSNNHEEIFQKLLKFKSNNIKIYCPLSYGDSVNAVSVAKKGKDMFGQKFVPMFDFYELKDYLAFLHSIDIAIFNHTRQQGLGNTISLLGAGKKVYLNSSSTLNSLFKVKGITVYNTSDINLELLPSNIKDKNQKIVKEVFSENELIESMKRWICR